MVLPTNYYYLFHLSYDPCKNNNKLFTFIYIRLGIIVNLFRVVTQTALNVKLCPGYGYLFLFNHFSNLFAVLHIL